MAKLSIYNQIACRGISNNKGMSLVAVVIVMLIAATLALFIASSISSGNISAVTDMQSEQAFYIAHAGMEWYLEQLENDSDWSTPPPVLTNQVFGAGTFTVTYVNQSTSAIDVTATGKIAGWDGNNVQRVITQHVTKSVGAGGYPGGVPEAFTYGIHCFGSNVSFKDSTGTLNGNVASTNQVKNYGGMTINGTITQNSKVAEPTPIDMAGYKSIAQNVKSGGFTFTSGTYGSPGNEQIWYITGSVTINSNVTIYGSVIAEGQINMDANSVIIDAASGYPALISGSQIEGEGLSNSTINGLIYADNNIEFEELSNVTMNTCMLAGNNISLKEGSNFTINYDSDITTHPPPYFNGYSAGSTTITTSLWQETL